MPAAGSITALVPETSITDPGRVTMKASVGTPATALPTPAAELPDSSTVHPSGTTP
jgi:hypothetical protein